MLNYLLRLYRDDQAATAVEYAVLLALILLAIISAINALGNMHTASGQMMRTRSDGHRRLVILHRRVAEPGDSNKPGRERRNQLETCRSHGPRAIAGRTVARRVEKTFARTAGLFHQPARC